MKSREYPKIKVQFQISKMLASANGNIFVVGDDDQSIYGWRGAKIENILEFDSVFEQAKIYKLERNYRSTKKILNLANCIIANNTSRREKTLWTDNQDGCKVETFVAGDENNEAGYVALQIKSLMARYSDLSYSDFAVFMRVNALSRAFEQEFTKYNIPYKIFGGFKFFERKEIKDILAYLKVINNTLDDESFLRAVGVPKRGIGDKTLRELREYCSGLNLSLFDGIDFVANTSIGASARTKLVNFKNLLTSFNTYSKDHSVVELMDYIIKSTDFLSQFEDNSEESNSKIYNINELKNSAEQFIKDNPNTTLADYLSSVTLSSDTDDINNDNSVVIATIHAAKGLEYKCVFIAGLDEKILPIARSLEGNEDELEEERRLLYVAITRAKERLYLLRANTRYMYGKRDYMIQSRFLKEAQPILQSPVIQSATRQYQSSYNRYSDSEPDSTSSLGGYSSTYAKNFLNATKPKEAVSKNTNYSTGCKVKHLKFGEGMVISTKGEGDNLVVVVAFKGVGIKTLSAKFAPMELI